MSTTLTDPQIEKMVFRGTDREKGRFISVTPSNSTNKHLSYGRIILDKTTSSVSFMNEGQETGLICLAGNATVRTGEREFQCGQYDSLYIPRGNKIEVSTAYNVDFAEFSCEVEKDYPLQFVSYS